MSRRLAREAIFKALFQVDVGDIEPGKALKYSLEGLILTPEEVSFASEIFSGILKDIDKINSLIDSNLVNWELKRIAAVDRCLLRLAIYEILFMPDIPQAVTINEALELGKKYSEPDSVAFMNGLLDSIAE